MTDQSPETPHSPSAPQDEHNNPVYKAGQAVAKLMALVWAVVVLVVLYLVLKFWLS